MDRLDTASVEEDALGCSSLATVNVCLCMPCELLHLLPSLPLCAVSTYSNTNVPDGIEALPLCWIQVIDNLLLREFGRLLHGLFEPIDTQSAWDISGITNKHTQQRQFRSGISLAAMTETCL